MERGAECGTDTRFAWLDEICNCDPPLISRERDCFHGVLVVWRQLRSGKCLVENEVGNVRLYSVSDLVFDPDAVRG